MSAVTPVLEGTDGRYRDMVDYILGITHEIWESRQVDRIYDYYDRDALVYGLGGFVRGAEAIVRNTRDTLIAFPDRLLLADSVVWSRESTGVYYTSHRISSPMTNSGVSSFGPATGRQVQVRTIADCWVENGVITREWLVRDNLSLVQQLGLDVHAIARLQAEQVQTVDYSEWFAAERSRVLIEGRSPHTSAVPWAVGRASEFATSVLEQLWLHGDTGSFEQQYAPYAVLHDSRPVASGHVAVAFEYSVLRNMVGKAAVSVDHVCVTPYGVDGHEVAVRWMLAGVHCGNAWGLSATGQPLMIMGVTHWQIVAGRIAAEWTIFDKLAVLAQLYRKQ